MTTLTQASRQLFSRPPDERFATLGDLHRHCQNLRNRSEQLREPVAEFLPVLHEQHLALQANGYRPCRLNDWSFTQLCSLAGAAKATVNRLQVPTAVQVLTELLASRPQGSGTLQALVLDETLIRAVNGERYTRLWNAELTAVLLEFAVDFTPPPKGKTGGTGLYAGEQDMFCFLIDPACWVEIGGEAFAPGFFVWNSEVGRRTVGVSTFWFQRLCANHILWDVTEVVQLAWRHVGKVTNSLSVVRAMIEKLVARRDERKDAFARTIKKAMESRYGTTGEEVEKLLRKAGFARLIAKLAITVAKERGSLSVWSIVDALTQVTGTFKYAGERVETDRRAAGLLALAGR